MTETLERTDIDVDLDTVVMCEMNTCDPCGNQAEWQWTFRCALTQHIVLACTPCKAETQEHLRAMGLHFFVCVTHSSPLTHQNWRAI